MKLSVDSAYVLLAHKRVMVSAASPCAGAIEGSRDIVDRVAFTGADVTSPLVLNKGAK